MEAIKVANFAVGGESRNSGVDGKNGLSLRWQFGPLQGDANGDIGLPSWPAAIDLP